MIWEYFKIFASSIVALWVVAIINMYFNKHDKLNLTFKVTALATALFAVFITILWVQLDRPPMRTLGETRLWYSLFSPVIGLIVYYNRKYKWFLGYSLFLASVFLIINIAKPDTYSQTLMPALQSPWFVPHVIVYMFAYALLGASSLVAVYGLFLQYSKKPAADKLLLADNLVYIGFSFLTMGLIFGALWAKQAWGHYWTWDPKETWAFITWAIYLLYIHFRYFNENKAKTHYWILATAFVFLLICWFGINYLPSAAESVHTYSN